MPLCTWTQMFNPLTSNLTNPILLHPLPPKQQQQQKKCCSFETWKTRHTLSGLRVEEKNILQNIFSKICLPENQIQYPSPEYFHRGKAWLFPDYVTAFNGFCWLYISFRSYRSKTLVRLCIQIKQNFPYNPHEDAKGKG